MKKLLYIFALAILFVGCRANFPVAQESGKEDRAFLLFVGNKEYGNKHVQVFIDNNVSFDAKVVKVKNANRKGTQYGVSTGTRKLQVVYEGAILFNKKVFLSPQEVKIIMLP